MSHVERKHSWLSPSGLHPILAGCVGKPLLERDCPERPAGEAAAFGTRVHEIAERVLNGERVRTEDVEEASLAISFVSYVQELINSLNEIPSNTTQLFTERKVSIFPELGIEGTSDVFIWNTVGSLHVIDLKTGRIPVSVVNNPQLLAYAWGFLKEHPHLVCLNVTFHIFQVGNVQEPWQISYEELQKSISSLESACKVSYDLYKEKVALEPDRHLHINDYCQYCRALSKCPRMRSHLEEKALVLFSDEAPKIPAVSSLTTAEKSAIFRAKKLFLSYLEAVEASIQQDLENGLHYDDVRLVPGRSRRVWNTAFDVASALKEAGIEEPYRKELITITEAEKRLGKKKALLSKDCFVEVVGDMRPEVIDEAQENRKKT